MTSHVHLVFRSINGQNPELLIGNLKRFTSQSIVKRIQENPKESRKEFLLDFFKKEAEKSSNVKYINFGVMITNQLSYGATRLFNKK